MNTEDKIKKLLTRGVEDILVKESLEKKLKAGKTLRVKLGIDPTSPDLHIGHAVVLRKLRAFQDLGHKAVLIIGDFTATIGDPTGKSTTRPPLSPETIKENMKQYISQAEKILDISSTEIHYNSEWLEPLSFAEVFKLAGLMSVTQMLERNDFKNRIAAGNSVRMHELFYPLMVSYDSVAIKADVELGGNDQLFNVLAGRSLMEKLELPPQDILTTSLLVGTDGTEKMSKSLGNYIALNDTANDMLGKIMSVKDELISNYFLLCTDIEESDIEVMEEEMKAGANPKEYKMRLASEIVTIYHGGDAADEAQQSFDNAFKKGGIPDDAPEVKVAEGNLLGEVLVNEKIVESKSEFSRLIKEGAISIVETEEKITEREYELTESVNLRIGKKRFVKIIVK